MAFNQLLDRYRAAAETISNATSVELLGFEPGTHDGADSDAVAMEELLQRQAKLLVKLHDDKLSSVGETRVVDERLLRQRLDDLASVSMSKFYSYRYDLLPRYWCQIYCDSLILITYLRLLLSVKDGAHAWASELDDIVEKLDRAVIMAGGTSKLLGTQWIEQTLHLMEKAWIASVTEENTERAAKRVKRGSGAGGVTFSDAEPHERPRLSQDCSRYSGWSIQQFEDYMNAGNGDPKPIVFTNLIQSWPALQQQLWCRPEYLLSKTFGGRRLVPVEVGRSYVDEGWGQELIPFREYLKRYVDPTFDVTERDTASEAQIGYLAQHDLFRQIPALRNDIQVPDLCWADVPGHPTDASKNQIRVDVPQLNAWFGPAKTITPLHTDGYHNLLCQVVGTKYVRLYPPSATKHMRPRAPEHGVDMSNTSALDVGMLEGWDRPGPDTDTETLQGLREELRGVEYHECILNPGDTLLIPIGWWHYQQTDMGLRVCVTADWAARGKLQTGTDATLSSSELPAFTNTHLHLASRYCSSESWKQLFSSCEPSQARRVSMEASSANHLLSIQKSSQLHAVLHPLVLLTISDYITRHTLREQTGPIIGALLGQQNGREITVEHAFECHIQEAPDVDGGYLLDENKFAARLEQMVTVHKDRQLDFVGWYTLLPADGPTPTILPIHNQILERWNESAILLGFHPQEVLHHSVGSKLPLTIFESNYEADESRVDNDGEDKKMDDGEPPLKLKFRELPYSVETDETEMISMNYVAGSGGSAAAVAARDEKLARSVESNGKGKRRLVESEPEELKGASGTDEDGPALTREEEETIATATAKANAIKMLQSRIQLLVAYLEQLPPSFINGDDAESGSMDTDGDHATPSLTVLREIKALIGRLDLVIPSDDESFEKERATETNDVNLVNMLSTLTQSVGQVRDVGKKFSIVETGKASQRRTGMDYPGGSYNLPGAGDLLI